MCPWKKRDQNVFLWYLLQNSSDFDKILRIVSGINLLQNFPLHLKHISTLSCKILKCSSHTCHHWVVRYRNSIIYSTLTVAFKIARFENSWLQNVGNIAREGVQTHITNMDLSTIPLTNGCHNDDMNQLGPLHSQLLFQFVQISDEYSERLLLLYSPHYVINWIQIWQIWRPQLRWKKFWSFFM